MEEKTLLLELSTETYNFICNSVLDYINEFASEDESIQRNYNLKKEHIHRVIGYTEVLTRNLELEEQQVLAAQLAALLHDVGRFEQFKQYQTFNDYSSIDHATLGVEIIEKQGWLEQLSDELKVQIRDSVSIHNKLEIPKNTTEGTAFLAKIIRDADKIDILDLAVNEYSQNNTDKNPAFTLGLEDSISISKNISKTILAGKLPDRKEMKTTTDFKLVQMAFIFDINFKESFSIINKKGLLKKIFDTLPKSDLVFDIYRKIKIYVENQLM